MQLETVTTGDIYFCSAVLFVYGEEVLTRIDTRQNQWDRDVPTFTVEVPDAKEIGVLQNDFQNGTLAISDLKSWIRTFTFLTRRLRDMRKRGETSWVA